jgi:glycosyltransferase involved in cell wall biosynthesis
MRGVVRRGTHRSLRPFEKGGHPKFSVVIPVYDRVQALRESILSILNQTYHNFELILVGDNPPVDTLSVIDEFRNNPHVRIYIYPDRSGNACRGRNKGITMASGEIIAFQDSDDIAFPTRLETAAYVFSNMCEGAVQLLYTGVQVLTDGSRSIENIRFCQEINPHLISFEELRETNPIYTSTVCVRRDILLLRGGFRTEMIYREDHELWLRLAHCGSEFYAIPAPMSLYRIHSGNAELLFIDRDSIWKNRMLDLFDKPWQSS